MLVAVLDCANCDHKTSMLDSTLQGISSSRKGLTRDERFACVLCSECGTATQFRLKDVCRYTSCAVSRGRILAEPDLVLVTLSCDGKNCSAHIKILAPSNTNLQNEATKDWKMRGVTCYEGYPARNPPHKLKSQIEHMKWRAELRRRPR